MAAGKEMELAIKIAGKVESSFKNALGQAASGLKSLTKTVAAATAAAALAIGAMGSAAIDVGREFETAMSQVSATMLLDKTTEEGQKAFETLENAARQCGRETAFSAAEAAEALNYLALAGYDADKAATALPTVLKLAGAGAMDLAAASDMVTDSMSALGIEATEENLKAFADNLAMTASKSNTSVAQLGEAILTVGGTAQGLAGGTTELSAALGILADSGIKASEGGTHLRNMILSLQNARNGDAAKLFEKMGISAYDAAGNMRSLGDVFGDLNASLAGASAEEVNRTLTTLFKQTDLASARVMLAATADSVESLGAALDASLADSGSSLSALGINLQEMAAGFDAATTQEQFAADMLEQYNMASEQAAVLFTGLQSVVSGTGNRFEELSGLIEESAGACEDMYAIQLDNLNGDIAILQSGLSDLGISVYKDLNGPLREMTQLATGMVEELSEAYQDSGLEGMVSAVGGCLSETTGVVAEYAPKAAGMGVGLLKGFISGITENAGELTDAATDVLSIFINGLFFLIPQVILAGTDIVTLFAQSITGQVPLLISNGSEAVANLVSGIVQRLPEVMTAAIMLVQVFADSLGQNAPVIISAAILLIGNLIMGIAQMLPQLLQTGIQLVLSLAQGMLSNLPLLLEMAVQMVTSLVTGVVQMIPMLIQGGIQLVIGLVQGIGQNLHIIVKAAVQIILTLATGILQAAPQLLSIIPQLVSALIDLIFTTDWGQVGIDIIKGIIDGIMSTGESLWNAVKSLITGKGADVPDTSDKGKAVTDSYANGIMNNAAAVTAATDSIMTNAFSSLDLTSVSDAGSQAGAAFAMGLTDSQMVTQAVETLGADVNTAFDGTWSTAETAAETAMQKISQTVTTEAQTAAQAVKSAFENMTITIPKPKIPVIGVSESSVFYGSGGSVSIPKFSVSWNALGGIFDQPTIFNTPAGMQGVGEAGPEAILPLDTLWDRMQDIVSRSVRENTGGSVVDDLVASLQGAGNSGGSQYEQAGSDSVVLNWNPTYNLYGSAGMDEIEKADRMSQEEFGRYMDQYLKDRGRRAF